MTFFGILTLLVFSFSLKIGGALIHEIGAGVFGSTLLFTTLLLDRAEYLMMIKKIAIDAALILLW